ncbi:MAG: hypothetical protein K0R26_894 [Bacteroidota bacterium]|jgi:hypothetical protein|nr:hypothetical protein [Bacteroidota bacterium]
MRLTQRLQLIKLITLIGLLVSVLCCHHLWAGHRYFPKASILEDFAGVPAPWDYLHLVVLVLLIILSSLTQKRLPSILLILFSVYLCLEDQNRLQPWFFNYIIILFVLLFYRYRVDESNNYTTVFISLQVLVSLIYIFSGIQKMNESFVPDTFLWMVSSFDTVLSERQLQLATRFGYIVPYFEMSVGILLLVKPLRFIIVPLVIIMHVLILVMLGPMGRNHNMVVWPWNMVMIALVLLLFANIKHERFFDISFLFKSFSFYTVLITMLVLPVFSLKNQYDSYLSSSLYSSNLHDCQLILSNKAYAQLPYYIRHFTTDSENHHVLYIKRWAQQELGAPCVPEYRVFKKVHHYIINLTRTNDTEVEFNFIERDKILDF